MHPKFSFLVTKAKRKIWWVMWPLFSGGSKQASYSGETNLFWHRALKIICHRGFWIKDLEQFNGWYFPVRRFYICMRAQLLEKRSFVQDRQDRTFLSLTHQPPQKQTPAASFTHTYFQRVCGPDGHGHGETTPAPSLMALGRGDKGGARFEAGLIIHAVPAAYLWKVGSVAAVWFCCLSCHSSFYWEVKNNNNKS